MLRMSCRDLVHTMALANIMGFKAMVQTILNWFGSNRGCCNHTALTNWFNHILCKENTPGSSHRVPASCFFSAFLCRWAPPKAPKKKAAAPSERKKIRRDPARGLDLQRRGGAEQRVPGLVLGAQLLGDRRRSARGRQLRAIQREKNPRGAGRGPHFLGGRGPEISVWGSRCVVCVRHLE